MCGLDTVHNRTSLCKNCHLLGIYKVPSTLQSALLMKQGWLEWNSIKSAKLKRATMKVRDRDRERGRKGIFFLNIFNKTKFPCEVLFLLGSD